MWGCVDVTWETGLTPDPIFGCSWTSANVGRHVHLWNPDGTHDIDAGPFSDADALCSAVGEMSTAQVISRVSTFLPYWCNTEMCSQAQTWNPAMDHWEAWSAITTYDPWCDHSEDGSGYWSYGWTYGYAYAEFGLNFLGSPGPRTSQWSATAVATAESDGITANGPKTVARQAISLAEQNAGTTSWCVLMLAGPYSRGVSMTFDPVNGVWIGQLQESGGPGEFHLALRQFTFIDSQIDVDGNGRFNGIDLAALAQHFGSNDPEILWRWDFDGSGMIDASDQALLESLVLAGLDSGLLGDLTRDGFVDCSDAVGIDGYFGYSLDEPEYRIELDSNLDGVTDADDREDVIQMIVLGDVTGDKVVDLLDLSAILVAFGSQAGQSGYLRAADLNRDGVVDLVDLSVCTTNMGRGC